MHKIQFFKQNKLLTFIFVFYLIFQLCILLQFKNNDPTFYSFIKITDSPGFYYAAVDIVNKNILGANGTYLQSPLYYYFLAILIIIFNNLFFIKFVQILFGSFNIIIIYFISLYVFNNKKYAIASTIILCFNGISIFYNTLILREFLVVLLNNLTILFFILALKNKNLKYSFLTGILFGLAILTRENFFIFFPVLIIIFFLKNKKKFISFIIGFCFIYSILIIRNYLSNAPLFKISSKGVYEFAAGNVPESNGLGWVELSSAQQIANNNKSLISAAFAILKLYKDNPINFLKLQLNKFLGFLNNYEIPNNYNFYFTKKNFSSLLNFSFVNSGIIFILSFIGFFFSFAKYKKNIYLWILISYIILYSFSVIGIYVISRFRIPVIVFLTIFAGVGLINIFEFIKKIEIKKIVIIFIIGIITYYFSFSYKPQGLNKEADLALAYANIGAYFRDIKEYDKALQYYFEAIKYYAPEEAILTIANIYKEKNDINNYLNWLEKCIEYYPQNQNIIFKVASIYFDNSNYAKAKYYFEKIINSNDFSFNAFFKLGIIYFLEKDFIKAEYYWNEALKLKPDSFEIKHNLAQIKKMLENPDRKIEFK
ncbi:MAG TPA: glycosyltransferase family 39 protein [bacterium]|nr:glycosyltransferase family 39 protein [bacterium]HOL47795.1 glycosyltransferase family 39 protein [bacterium]HPQ18630.1 glycosyltransferase family 39 protein [bacterium]